MRSASLGHDQAGVHRIIRARNYLLIYGLEVEIAIIFHVSFQIEFTDVL